jgi:hypothetical protein
VYKEKHLSNTLQQLLDAEIDLLQVQFLDLLYGEEPKDVANKRAEKEKLPSLEMWTKRVGKGPSINSKYVLSLPVIGICI